MSQSSAFYWIIWQKYKSNAIINAIEKGYNKIVIIAPSEMIVPGLFETLQEFKFFDSYCKVNNIPFKWITSGFSSPDFLNPRHEFYTHKDVLFWDNYFLYDLLRSVVEGPNRPLFPNLKNLDKHFISLNNRPHTFRLNFIDHIFNTKLPQYGYISAQAVPNNYKWKYWKKPKRLLLDKDFAVTKVYQPIPFFKNSLFSLICESSLNVLDISEKTYMALFNKRPFLVYGHPLLHTRLKKIGFELFDELFDYDFDTEWDDEKRLTDLLVEFEKILQCSPLELYNLLKEKIEHNFNHLFSLIADKNYLNEEIYELILNYSLPDSNPIDPYKYLLGKTFRKKVNKFHNTFLNIM